MRKRKFSGNISNKGYYIALILCAAAIGISGYLYYQNTTAAPSGTSDPTSAAQTGTVDGQGNVPVVATDPQSEPTEPSTVPTKPAKDTLKTASPLTGNVISVYAMDSLSYNQTTRDWRVHNGIDIAADAGTPVASAAAGTVYTVYEDDALGTTVVIRHADNYTTVYANLSEAVTVSPGDSVRLGQIIGTVGQTALLESAIGPHLHFSVSCNGESVDPAVFLALS